MIRIAQPFLERIKKSPLVLFAWYIGGKKIPPPHVYKQKVVSQYGKKYNISTFYESGTYKGDMVYGMKNKFKRIVSVELSNYYYELAKNRFKKNPHITIIQGDSGKEIKKFLTSYNKPGIFWLDGHYSFGNTAKAKVNTPVINELKTILNHQIKAHVILIDDARHFNGKDDYPKINQIRKLFKNSNYNLQVDNDIIRITPFI